MPEVLAFGTYDSKKHPRVEVLINGLEENGCHVTEINHPLGLSTSQRVDILKKPWKLFGFGTHILKLWYRLARDSRRHVHSKGSPDVVLIGYMGHFDILLARFLFPHTPLALDHLIFAGDTAKDRGAGGIKVRLLGHLDRMAITRADLVIVDTQEHQRMLRPGDTSMVVPVGAPAEWYLAGARQAVAATAAENASQGQSGSGIVFFGLFTPLQGTPVIAQALSILNDKGVNPHMSFVGSGQDYPIVRRLLKDMDIEFIPWIKSEQLPDFVAGHAISLGIFSKTPKGLRVVPNKVYQSMAAGCAVITSDTPPQRRELGDGAIFTSPGDPRALAAAIERLLNDPRLLEQARARARRTSHGFTEQEVTKQLAQWVTARHEASTPGARA